MKLAAIVAMTREGVIGRDNQLPWRLPQDLKRFRAITTGHPVIMGRKTWDSIGRALPGRLNIVVTRNPKLTVPQGVALAASLDEAIALARRTDPERSFVIGGGELFRKALEPHAPHKVEELFVTWIDAPIIGDAHFPLELLNGFEAVASESFAEPLPHSFVDYRRAPDLAAPTPTP